MFDGGARDQSEFLSAWRCRTSFGGHKRLTPFLISRLFAHWCGQPTEGSPSSVSGQTETPADTSGSCPHFPTSAALVYTYWFAYGWLMLSEETLLATSRRMTVYSAGHEELSLEDSGLHETGAAERCAAEA